MKKYNFIDILTNEIVVDVNQSNEGSSKTIIFKKIEIPMIQRDYAQGRNSESVVRDKFLNAIFDALGKGQDLDLDFVYGSIWESEDKKVNAFIPLDGQQRLTTLFLLHWYIGSLELDEDKWDIQKENLKKFTYATRISSRRFCEKLVDVNLRNYVGKSPKEVISDFSWFYLSYGKDPTVESMLNMIEAINAKYQQNPNRFLWDNLQKLKFYLLPLDGFMLTEELYVKMNARGKQLTDFENFKADLINWLKGENNPFKEQFSANKTLNNREMPYYLAFSEKLDTQWTSFFWEITKNYDITAKDEKTKKLIYPNGKVVDPLFIRFFYRYLLNVYVLTPSLDDDGIDFKTIYDENKFQNFTVFKGLFEKENIVTNIERILDAFVSHWDSITKTLNSPWGDDLDLFAPNLTQPERVVLFATMLYLEKFEYHEHSFKQWLRVVWNIVENTDINSKESMIAALKTIEKLSFGANEIYKYLSDNKPDVSSSKEAVKEEIDKSVFIIDDIAWEEEFKKAEAHQFFKGSVGFIIESKMTISEFQHRREMACNVFDKEGVTGFYYENHLFLRALISIFDKSNEIIGKNFTDRKEKENYLKKMLTSNEPVRKATKEWFSLENEILLKDTLRNSISRNSELVDRNNNSNVHLRKIHEALYKAPDLQFWMQETKAIRIEWRNDHICVFKPSTRRDKIILDNYLNEIINELIINNQGITNNQCEYQKAGKKYFIGYFWGYDNIEVKATMNNESLKFIFDRNELKIELMIDNEWQEKKRYDYHSEVTDINGVVPFLQKIQNEVKD